MPDSFAHEVLCKLAYQSWQERGCPLNSPEVDWQRALAQLHQQQQPRSATPLVNQYEMLDATDDN